MSLMSDLFDKMRLKPYAIKPKKCAKCKEVKPADQFYSDVKGLTLKCYCKPCFNMVKAKSCNKPPGGWGK